MKLSHLLLRLAMAIAWAAGSMGVQAQTITVAAAASLGEALREIGSRFESQRPGVKLRWNFAASGVLIQQILNGAPVDVLVSADAELMALGFAQKALVAETRRDIASNTLVLVVPAQQAVAVAALGDLAAPAVRRIAIGKPASVPAGRYARHALQAAGLWAALEPKFVPADNVRQVLDYVARGDVEAGFVYRTDAALASDRVRVVLAPAGVPPIAYPAAVVATSRQPALARDFHAFLLSAQAQALLAGRGFGRP
jgi:molybdate transport system substrate-binding protein